MKTYKEFIAESQSSTLAENYESFSYINDLDTPDLYRLYLTIEGLKYTQPLHDAIKEKLRQAGRLAADAAQYAKTRK